MTDAPELDALLHAHADRVWVAWDDSSTITLTAWRDLELEEATETDPKTRPRL
jgi:hypothetical protein